jgi:SAM-dependent methyltransferase
MNSSLYTYVGHRHLAFMNPFGEATMSRVIDLLAMSANQLVVDFGAGWCELPLRLIEKYAVHADCVELSPLIAGEARARAAKRVDPERIRIHEGDAGTFKATIPPAAFDLAVCIGSSHALGGPELAITTLARLTRPGGRVLVGEAFWKAAPNDEYLKATGLGVSEFSVFTTPVALGVQAGLLPELCIAATEREFDEYEWAHQRAIEAYADEHPSDDQALGLLSRGRVWRENYLKYGRDILGFALYLLRKPA